MTNRCAFFVKSTPFQSIHLTIDVMIFSQSTGNSSDEDMSDNERDDHGNTRMDDSHGSEMADKTTSKESIVDQGSGMVREDTSKKALTQTQ